MISKRPITLLAGGAVLLTALALAACGGSGKKSGSSGPPKTAGGKAATIGVSNTGIGNILVSSRGLTLYTFSKDSGTTSTCTGACAVNWPPLRANGKPTVGNGAKTSIVSTTPRSDGKPQVTYNGHPVYLFDGDSKPGDTNGEGLNAFGGTWLAISPSGKSVSAQVSNQGGGGGVGY
jgi:predicted lipoprotein with Yx(FWY)xxD motif